jgi:hypothetical protein
VNATEPHEAIPQPTLEPPGPSPSVIFIFIDLREDPTAWAQIENELAEDSRFTAH